MTVVNSNNLQYPYTWAAYKQNDPRVSGEPDNTLLRKDVGNEVLYFINKFCEWYLINDVSTAQKIERMIQASPQSIYTQFALKQWILKNWN